MRRMIDNAVNTATQEGVKQFWFSNSKDVETLWNEFNETRVLPWTNVLLMVDEPLLGGGSTIQPNHWLTPWDWAMAMSAQLIKRASLIPEQGFRCWLIDLLPDGARPGRRRFKTAGAFSPWIRWYRPTQQDQQHPLAKSITSLFFDLSIMSDLPRLMREDASSSETDALLLAWGSMFSAPESRHAIGNLVGALVLAEALKHRMGIDLDLAEDVPTRNFQSLVRTIHAVSSHEVGADVVPPIADEILSTSDWFNCYRRVRITLIDDQWRHGYHRVLASLMFGHQHSSEQYDQSIVSRGASPCAAWSVSSSADCTDLLRLMQDALNHQPSWSLPRIIGDDAFDVLLLDLRLFAESTSQYACQAEQDFLLKALQFCRKNDCNQLRDPHVAAAIDGTQKRLESGLENIACLTLLPLLLSYVDPSLPIILFSSSRQREVSEFLKHRPNIITTFSKPLVNPASAQREAVESLEALRSALLKALKFHKLRTVWREVYALSFDLWAEDKLVTEREISVLSKGKPQHLQYTLRSQMCQILQMEYQRLLLCGSFADALMLPHNLLELGGGDRVESTSNVFPVLELAQRAQANEDWISLIDKLLHEPSEREKVQKLLRKVVFDLRPDPSPLQMNEATNLLSKGLTHSVQTVKDWISAVCIHHPIQARYLEAQFNSLESAITLALERRRKAEHEQLVQFLSNDQIAEKAYYTLLAIVRNARGHFIIRPLEHDQGLEDYACWVLLLFLRGSRLLIRGGKPIRRGPGATPENLVLALKNQWISSSNRALANYEGPELCRQVFTSLGQLCRLGIVTFDPVLKDFEEYACSLAD